MNIIKKNQTHRYREQTSDYQQGGTNYRVRDRLKDIHCPTQGIPPIFCNNCKWKVTFKHCILKKSLGSYRSKED